MRKVLTFFLFGLAIFSNSIVFGQESPRIVMLMPFCSKKILANPNHSDAQLSNLSREYYQGAMIAADSLERAAIPILLSVFDTENDSLVLVSLLKKNALKEADFILGPV
jgi:hypothetical protein